MLELKHSPHGLNEAFTLTVSVKVCDITRESIWENIKTSAKFMIYLMTFSVVQTIASNDGVINE
jgi:hypothetical protein